MLEILEQLINERTSYSTRIESGELRVWDRHLNVKILFEDLSDLVIVSDISRQPRFTRKFHLPDPQFLDHFLMTIESWSY